VSIPTKQPGYLIVSFTFRGVGHSVRLRRVAGIWHIREWICSDGVPTPPSSLTGPRFDALIASALGSIAATNKAPQISVKEIRCPDDPRKLFLKIIVQQSVPRNLQSNLIEVSCPQCKRLTGEVTFHYYTIDGTFVKTDQMGPWIKREPVPWFTAEAAS
jgi:hypothetical protein